MECSSESPKWVFSFQSVLMGLVCLDYKIAVLQVKHLQLKPTGLSSIFFYGQRFTLVVFKSFELQLSFSGALTMKCSVQLVLICSRCLSMGSKGNFLTKMSDSCLLCLFNSLTIEAVCLKYCLITSEETGPGSNSRMQISHRESRGR